MTWKVESERLAADEFVGPDLLAVLGWHSHTITYVYRELSAQRECCRARND